MLRPPLLPPPPLPRRRLPRWPVPLLWRLLPWLPPWHCCSKPGAVGAFNPLPSSALPTPCVLRFLASRCATLQTVHFG